MPDGWSVVNVILSLLPYSREIYLDYKSDEIAVSWESLLVSLAGYM